MKKVGLSLIIMLSCIAMIKAQWVNLASPTTTNLYATYFSNYDTGYAVGGNINSSLFLKTTNGGADWNVITNTQTKWIYDVVFINDSVGIACGYEGAIYKTTDAGLTWEAKPSQTIAWLYSITKKPDGTLFAVGQDGILIKSINQGDNWTPAVSSTIQTMLDIQFYDNNIGAAVGYAGEMIYTTDGGNNWGVRLMGTPISMTGLWILSPDTLVICGMQGKVYTTFNAGLNFTYSTLCPNDFNAVYFADGLNGHLAGNQKIFETTNGGNSWVEVLPYPAGSGMRDIHISSDNRVMYAVGSDGSIIKNINTIGVDENEMSALEILVYPNPSADLIHIPLVGSYQVYLYNMKGAQIQSAYFNEVNEGFLDVSNLPDGKYILEIIKDQKYSRLTIVIKN